MDALDLSVVLLYLLGMAAVALWIAPRIRDTRQYLIDGLLGIYLTGFLSRIGDARAVWVGIALTLAFTAWTLLQKQGWLPAGLTLPFDLYYTGLIGNLVMIAGIVMTALVTGTRRRNPTDA